MQADAGDMVSETVLSHFCAIAFFSPKSCFLTRKGVLLPSLPL